MKLPLKVVPGSSRDRVVGWIGHRLKVAVAAPPERGKANQAVLELLGEALGVKVRLVAGGTAALKTVEIDLPDADVFARLPVKP